MDKITGFLMIIMGVVFFFDKEFIIGNIILNNLSTTERWFYAGVEIAIGIVLILGSLSHARKKDREGGRES